jgi:hypothetical protein
VRHASMHLPIRILSSLSPIAFLLVLGTTAQADSINVNYSTSMVISDIGVSGSPAVSYQGLSGATVTTLATATYGAVLDPAPSGVGSALSLGAFTFNNPAGGGTTTYVDTPFYLSVTINSVNGDGHAANPSTYVVDGYLTGTISTTGASSFTATFVRPDWLSSTFPAGMIGSFSSGGYDTFLSIPFGSAGINDPTGTPTGGLSMLGGIVSEHAAPEPASAVVLALLALGQVATVRLRNRRGRNRVA